MYPTTVHGMYMHATHLLPAMLLYLPCYLPCTCVMFSTCTMPGASCMARVLMAGVSRVEDGGAAPMGDSIQREGALATPPYNAAYPYDAAHPYNAAHPCRGTHPCLGTRLQVHLLQKERAWFHRQPAFKQACTPSMHTGIHTGMLYAHAHARATCTCTCYMHMHLYVCACSRPCTCVHVATGADPRARALPRGCARQLLQP